MTVIIDYGVGNIGSIANMLKRLEEPSLITADHAQIASAERLILCGIGAFDNGMRRLEDMGIVDLVKKKVLEDKTPILGICLGMQLFTKGSEEGNKEGFGFIDGFTRKFQFAEVEPGKRKLRIPHMGWNRVTPAKDSSLVTDMDPESRFYFVHSYHVVPDDPAVELYRSSYGYEFTAAFEKDNIVGAQFHPEKSHKYGIQFFRNFVKRFPNG
jgi:glutamine amidotransferase